MSKAGVAGKMMKAMKNPSMPKSKMPSNSAILAAPKARKTLGIKSPTVGANVMM